MGKSRASRNKVFVEEKKERKDKSLVKKLEEQTKEIARLKREIEDLRASGKVPVEKPVKKVTGPPKMADVEKEKQDVRDKFKRWREENLGKYNEEE